MREYELTVIIQPEISDEGIEAIRERLGGILESHGADKLFYDDIGKRRLAYGIRRFQKGHYFTLFFLDEGKAVGDLERALKLDDSVLRFLTVLADPRVKDIEARKAEAAELERQRAEKAAERAAREAEDAAREAEEAAAREVEEAARAAAAAAAAEEAKASAAAAAAGAGEGEAVQADAAGAGEGKAVQADAAATGEGKAAQADAASEQPGAEAPQEPGVEAPQVKEG